jgi:glutamine---fructose-6-phosphate transaminase (isomerizing)
MCGIIGVLSSEENVSPILVNGLRRLEYRGYDSSGIATTYNGEIERRRVQGKIENLEALLKSEPIHGRIGIAHTRWATHGVPSVANAHPHATDKVAVVHNGIIENYHDLREQLLSLGHKFEGQTDSEIIPHIINEYLNKEMSPEEAVSATLRKLKGSYGLVAIFSDQDNTLIAARSKSPMAIGLGDEAIYVASDLNALGPVTDRFMFLHEGDQVVINSSGIKIMDLEGFKVERQIDQNVKKTISVGKNGFRHFMQKEIQEQPAVAAQSLDSFWMPDSEQFKMPVLPFDIKKIQKLTIVACGTSYYAGMVAKYWLEEYADISVDVDIASEYRYRKSPIHKNSAAMFISQSGETADSLAALEHCKENGTPTLSVINVEDSSMDRLSDGVLYTLAGPEIGVASTKAFITQLTTLACFTLAVAQERGADPKLIERMTAALRTLPVLLQSVLAKESQIVALAQYIFKKDSALFLSRGNCYPIALEGALKLKEISYIHAEGFAAGELKHGPLALVDPEVPVIVLAPENDLFEKTLSNISEVTSRLGKVFLFSNQGAIDNHGDSVFKTLALPKTDSFIEPILYTIPMQLLAYHVAVLKGTDVDQPRNLAKSVTVE